LNLEEVREVYARSLANRERSTPPPGYTGTAFVGGDFRDPGAPMAGKRHTPEEYAPPRSPVQQTPSRPAESAKDPVLPDAVGELLRDLKGKIGREELVLLLVMLLLAADGAGIETLLLGLILLTSRE
jgi:hypothetical protein